MAKARTRAKRETKKRSLSVRDRQQVRILAEQLGGLIPLSGFRSTFNINQLAKERGLIQYLPKKSQNKKESLAVFLENIISYHPRTLKKIVQEILPKAIERRHQNGNPVLAVEADIFATTLFDLGIDLRKEIKELHLPTERPTIVPPPPEVRKMIETYPLHPTLLPDCKNLFLGGHINESVRKALEKYELLVQQLSSSSRQGKDLMATVFSEQSPAICVVDTSTQAGCNTQEGMKFISMGIMQWWRNNLSHGDEAQIPHHEAFSRLILVSNLLHTLDERVV
jgi:uncharacterized protein (TIGR02391 family)